MWLMATVLNSAGIELPTVWLGSFYMGKKSTIKHDYGTSEISGEYYYV